MSFVKLLQRRRNLTIEESVDQVSDTEGHSGGMKSSSPKSPSPQVSALRLLELSQRTSDVMKASDVTETQKHDPILKIFNTFASLNGITVSDVVMSIVLEEEFVSEIAAQVSRLSPQLVILPWYTSPDCTPGMDAMSVNPIEKMLSNTLSSSSQYASLVRSIYQRVECDVAVLVDSGFQLSSDTASSNGSIQVKDGKQNLLCLFLGGPDDRAALSLVMQLCQHSDVYVNVLQVVRSANPTAEDDAQITEQAKSTLGQNSHTFLSQITINNSQRHPADTLHGPRTSTDNIQSVTADKLLFDAAVEMTRSNSRLQVETIGTSLPLQTIISRVQQASHASELMIVTGRSRHGGEGHAGELGQFLKERVGEKPGDPVDLSRQIGIVACSDVRKSLGDVTSALIASQIHSRILVIQASTSSPNPSQFKIEDMEKMT